MTRVDKLGRKIPEFDRSAASKKGAQTRKDKDGNDIYSRIGGLGGSTRTRGYFGKLKAEGKENELKKLSKKGVNTRRSRRGGDSVSGSGVAR